MLPSHAVCRSQTNVSAPDLAMTLPSNICCCWAWQAQIESIKHFLLNQGRLQGDQRLHSSKAAKQAMVAGDYKRAIDLYTQASKWSPSEYCTPPGQSDHAMIHSSPLQPLTSLSRRSSCLRHAMTCNEKLLHGSIVCCSLWHATFRTCYAAPLTVSNMVGPEHGD